MANKKKDSARKTAAPSKRATKRPAPKKTAPKKAAPKKSVPKKSVPRKKARPKAPVRRVTPKVSTQRGSTVLAWAEAKLQGWQQEILHAIGALVAREAPGAQAVIKWAQPVFELGGPFAYVRGAKEHVTFGFWRGAELADPAGLLHGDGSKMKHLKVRHPDDINRAEVVAMVREAVALNASKGDPTQG